MPILTTFAGAAARVYGLGGGAAAPILPANTILLWSVTDTSSVPAGWAIHTQSQGKFFMGANSSSNIGAITTPSTGTSTSLSLTSSSAGAHSGATFSRPANTSPGSFTTLYTNTGTTHAHSGATTLTADNVVPDAESFPTIYNSGQLSKIPPNTIVFRKTQPSSVSFTLYTSSMPSSRLSCGYRGGSSKGYANCTGAMTGTSVSGGAHSHYGSYNNRGGSYTTGGGSFRNPYANDNGSSSHTHSGMTIYAAITLQSKTLTAWISSQEENIEYGMIVMYAGSINQIPPGWRICDGSLGTPDMVGWYLGRSTTVTTHGDQISATTIARADPDDTRVGATNTDSWIHDHPTAGFYAYTGEGAYHTLYDAAHYHVMTVSGTASINNYDPGHMKVAFIQYKGI